jgi:hypothetical protein
MGRVAGDLKMKKVKYYVCKTCGRGFASLNPPAYCYADRMDSMEEVNEEGKEQMGLFKGFTIHMGHRGYAYEFPGDVQFDPFNGEGKEGSVGFKLDDFQDKIMEGLRAN